MSESIDKWRARPSRPAPYPADTALGPLTRNDARALADAASGGACTEAEFESFWADWLLRHAAH